MPRTVSVITRTKDRPLLLPRACASVLHQSWPHWEHVIVNDAGDRDLLESQLEPLRESYGDRLKVVHREASTGMEAASNAAIRASSGEFLTIHDDDDTWHPRFLEKMVSVLTDAGSDALTQGVVCHCTRVVEALHDNGPIEQFRHPFTQGLEPIRLWRTLEENTFPPISFLFRRSAWDAIGPFDESLPVLGDWEFNVRFLRRFEIAVLPEYLAFYHHRVAQLGPEIYANTVTAKDHLHRETEAALVERWAQSDQATERALAAACLGARRNLLLRRELLEREGRITALQTEKAALESGTR
jgi:glycosyltransferase involved in cell wall biosynthesis